jgi:hypothetical protein
LNDTITNSYRKRVANNINRDVRILSDKLADGVLNKKMINTIAWMIQTTGTIEGKRNDLKVNKSNQ